jgi:hypothetical protein
VKLNNVSVCNSLLPQIPDSYHRTAAHPPPILHLLFIDFMFNFLFMLKYTLRIFLMLSTLDDFYLTISTHISPSLSSPLLQFLQFFFQKYVGTVQQVDIVISSSICLLLID